ncbi:MAG: dihydrolipoyl dehydrogenase [Methylococcales bacterium]|jgi:dihydrolipoamide dehydrogenase|nr:dihydrolipoyl dehydrogenase [Methylococcales bacterium]MBT7443280.1 dihydrolipoyl dehydrogenase [Methylococcales bacterium]
MSELKSYNVIVIGAGPAGYVAAIRCAQLGLTTACVDMWLDNGKPTLGGTCLNVGCIPSKALLESSEKYHEAQNALADFGVEVDNVSLNLKTMMDRKGTMVKQLTQGIQGLFKANGIEWLKGHGKLLANKQVEVIATDDSVTTYQAEHIILATGSSPVDIGIAKVNKDTIVDSSGALSFTEVPAKLGVIGAGVIGLELGSVWKRLGSEVVILEAQDEFLPMADTQVSREALKQYKAQGLNINLSTRVTKTEVADNQVTVHYQDKDGDQTLVVDKLIVAVGRTPNSNQLASRDTDLLLDEGNFVHVDEQCRTNIPSVYAIGDLVRGPMLAHKGSEEGIAVAETIANDYPSTCDLDLVPSVIYTLPEIAWVGTNEKELKAAGIEYNSGSFPFAAIGRAHAMNQTAGFVKILADKTTDRILGVHIIGPAASELITEAVVAMEFSASSEDLARTIHAHPTLSEAMHEAALSVDNRAIHKANRKKKKK